MTDNVNDDERSPLLSRRQVLELMGAAGLVIVVGCSDDGDSGSGDQATTPAQSATATPGRSATAAPTTATTSTPLVNCVVTPALTEGPYFVDERINRSDIRSDPTTGAVSEGIPLRLLMTVSTVEGGACSPLAGVEFLTIYPGWYSGRAIHIHYKVRTDPDAEQGLEFTSQLFFDEEINDTVTATRSPYSQKGTPDQRNSTDNIFDSQLIVPLVADGDGYAGNFHVGVGSA
jgi:protocatechuate 3,4-dioxygenase beta subunit